MDSRLRGNDGVVVTQCDPFHFFHFAAHLAISGETPNISFMRNIISIIIGLFALLLMIPAFIPLLGWANWIIIPIAIVGLAIGAMSDRTSGRNLNAALILVGIGRLMLGGGIL